VDPLHGAQGPGADPRGSLWFTLFDAAAEGPRAAKVTHPDPRARGADHIEIGGSSFGPAGARGEALDASWDLTHVGGEPPLLHLPRDWMYRAPIPRTKTLSPHPAALFRGSLTVGGRTLELEGWPGMVGHNWGAEHAERWIWLHGIGFGAVAEGSWIDVALGRIRLGPLTTPWIANGAICLGGIRHRLGGVERTRSTRVHESPTRCEFVLPGAGISVRGSVSSEAKNFVGWAYADPADSEHNALNCSIADMRLAVTRHREPDLTLETRARGDLRAWHARDRPRRADPAFSRRLASEGR
jgi:hypothetical protein